MVIVRRPAGALSLAGVVILAGASLNRVYNGHLLLELVAGSAAGSVLLSLMLRRVPSLVAATLSLVALAGYALVCVGLSARAAAVPGALGDLALDAGRNAIPRLLTALIPVEPQPDTVLAPVVLAWLAGLAGAELAVRVNRPALGCVPPVLLYCAALVLVGPNSQVVIWQPVAVAALVTVVLAVGDERRRSPGAPRSASGVRAAASVASSVVAVLAIVAAVSPLVAHRVVRMPADPRAMFQPPELDTVDENPLIRLSGWTADPARHLFDVAVLAGPPAARTGAYDTRLRLAVLEEWDGVTWHTSADYRGAGRVLPAPGDETGHPDLPPMRIRERITIDGLEGRLLPATRAPQRVDGVRVSYDRASGTLLRDSPLSAGDGYTVSSASPAVDVDLLPAADVPSGPSVAHLLAVGDEVPPDLSHLAEVVTVGQSAPYERAMALQSYLSQHYRFAVDAPSGHAYPNLRFFLFAEERAGGRRGTSEQFAAAFAALGRLMGLPTRVVVGFATPAGGGPVTAGDALAWPEVLFNDVGWVPFDPLPRPNSQPEPLEDQFLPQPSPSTDEPETVPPETPTASAGAPARSSALVVAERGHGPGTVAVGIGGGVLLLSTVGALTIAILRAWVRRRRLDRGSASQRVVGAWNDVLDTLLLARERPPPHLAATGVAAYATTVAGLGPGRRHTRRPRPAPPLLDDLATKVNTVGFAPPGRGMDDLAAHSARVAALAYARAVRARQAWWLRLLWSIDPRPLRRRR